jgi:hypothetical protein
MSRVRGFAPMVRVADAPNPPAETLAHGTDHPHAAAGGCCR